MKKVNLLTLFAFMSTLSIGAQSAFLIDEEGDQPVAVKPLPAQRAAPVPVRQSAPVPVAVSPSDPTAFGQVRTFIKHKGRKPAVFGRPVVSQPDTTLSLLVVDVMPEQFQAFAAENVDMGVSVKGGKSDNWVAALSGALRETSYAATIDWDKREVLFEVNTTDAEPLRAVSNMVKQQKTWSVNIKDGLLSRVLSRWCTESGGECVRFINQSSSDLEIDGELVVSGDFRSAVDQLMSAVSGQAGAVFIWKVASNKILILSDGPAASTR